MRWRGVFGKRRKEIATVYVKNVEWDLGVREKESRGWESKEQSKKKKHMKMPEGNPLLFCYLKHKFSKCCL